MTFHYSIYLNTAVLFHLRFLLDLCHRLRILHMKFKYESCHVFSQNRFGPADVFTVCYSSWLVDPMCSFICSILKCFEQLYFFLCTQQTITVCTARSAWIYGAFVLLRPCKTEEPVKYYMCNGENDQNRKLSQDWKAITFLKKGVVVVSKLYWRHIHLVEISELSGNLT